MSATKALRVRRRGLPWQIPSAAVALVLLGLAPAHAADDPDNVGRDHVRLVERRQGEIVSLWAQLVDCAEATVAVDLTLINMEASRRLPITVDVDGPLAEIVRMAPIDPRFQHQYRYSFT